ncbi:MAG: response regulator [Chloroflexi bacterium]|nr:response regulator [Chloroflexota bacterium]
MEYLPEILKAIASLLWPVIVIVILLAFRKPVEGLIETARLRKFTVKVGEVELSMEEYNKQQSDLIKDLQNQVAALQKLHDLQQPGEEVAYVRESAPRPQTRSLLWVDNHPRNNAVMMESLREAGISVTTALDTQEALGKLRTLTFDKIVTDLDHPDNGNSNATAGIELVKSVRVMNKDMPIYIYTSAEKAEKMFLEAQEAGANQITGSPTILMALLKA